VGWSEEAWEVGEARKRKGTTASVVGRSEEAWQKGEARKWQNVPFAAVSDNISRVLWPN
jgi:hypothetical protein